MLSGFCPARFAELFCSVVLGCDTHLKLLNCVVSGASFLTGGLFEFDLTHRRSVAVLWMLYKIRCNSMHPLYLYLSRMGRCVFAILSSHIGTLMHLLAAESESRSTERFLFPCQYLYLTILVTPYLMVCDWRVLRAGRMPLYWPSCSLPILSLLFFLFLH